MTREIVTDRDPAFCIGSTSDGRVILATEWVDLAALLGVVPRACRPYRAKTKGKVERTVCELKEGFLPWLSGEVLPHQPTILEMSRCVVLATGGAGGDLPPLISAVSGFSAWP